MSKDQTADEKFAKSEELIYVGSQAKLKRHINALESDWFNVEWLNDTEIELYIKDYMEGVTLPQPSKRKSWEASYHDEFRIRFIEQANPVLVKIEIYRAQVQNRSGRAIALCILFICLAPVVGSFLFDFNMVFSNKVFSVFLFIFGILYFAGFYLNKRKGARESDKLIANFKNYIHEIKPSNWY